ncbi:MAG: hypothetical protein KAQ62_17335, partial [Cyclobacteriaceae bacterium]|nr:hypothetical protein [Cyclobacteriaceae bacterium]
MPVQKTEKSMLSFPKTQESRKSHVQPSWNSGKAKQPRSAFLKLRKAETATRKPKSTHVWRKSNPWFVFPRTIFNAT